MFSQGQDLTLAVSLDLSMPFWESKLTIWYHRPREKGFYSTSLLNYVCVCYIYQAWRALNGVKYFWWNSQYVTWLSLKQVTWLIAPENMSHTSALKLSGTPLSIRSWVLTVRYIQTPLEDAKTRNTSHIQMRLITLLMDTYYRWTALLSRHPAMVPTTYKHNSSI